MPESSDRFSRSIRYCFAFILCLGCLHIVSIIYHFFRISLVPKSVTTSIKVYPGRSAYALALELHQQNIIQNPWVFSGFINFLGDQRRLRFGEYEIKYPMTTWNLLQNITHGRGFVKHRLTLVEGWTFQQLRDAIAANKDITQTLINQPKSALLKSLGSSHDNPEGLFYPNTYFFTWGNTDFSVYQMAFQTMRTTAESEWNARVPNLPYQSMYQALIVASLIERETSVESEKPIIASVILNRLKKNMRLQIDPTVLYGLHQPYGDTITKSDLASNTPYNTYVRYGLPPTPICMPSKSSIFAALHPATTDYLYYVASGNGGHAFSKTYAEHEKQNQQRKSSEARPARASALTNTNTQKKS